MEDMNKKYKLLQRDAFTIIALVLFTLYFGKILAAYTVNIKNVHATGTCEAGWRIGFAHTINCHGICTVVGKQHWGDDFFVPTATSIEWENFLTNPPTQVILRSCEKVSPRQQYIPRHQDYDSCRCVWSNPCADHTNMYDYHTGLICGRCSRATTREGYCVQVPAFQLYWWHTSHGLECRGGKLSNIACQPW